MMYVVKRECGGVLRVSVVVCTVLIWLKLTWRRVQGDQECSDPGWRLTIALRWVEARDGP